MFTLSVANILEMYYSIIMMSNSVSHWCCCCCGYCFGICEAGSQEAVSGEVLAFQGCLSVDLMLQFFWRDTLSDCAHTPCG